MKLEPIDTSTTAGKAEVMRLAAEGRKIAYREEDISQEWFAVNESDWDWRTYDYAIIAEPIGPDEVLVVVGADMELFSEAGAKGYAEQIGGTVVRYRRVEE